jgi:hypothetical protein
MLEQRCQLLNFFTYAQIFYIGYSRFEEGCDFYYFNVTIYIDFELLNY